MIVILLDQSKEHVSDTLTTCIEQTGANGWSCQTYFFCNN